MKDKRVVYPISGDDMVSRLGDLTYLVADGDEFKLDVYIPATLASPFAVVVFVHGDGPPDVLRDIKDWGQYVSWGELTASAGVAGVTFNHRSSQRRTRMHEVASDLEAALDFVSNHAEEWGVDASRVGLWSCSMGVPFALRVAFDRSASPLRGRAQRPNGSHARPRRGRVGVRRDAARVFRAAPPPFRTDAAAAARRTSRSRPPGAQ